MDYTRPSETLNGEKTKFFPASFVPTRPDDGSRHPHKRKGTQHEISSSPSRDSRHRLRDLPGSDGRAIGIVRVEETTRKLPATVQHTLVSMPAAAQAAFFAEFDRKRRKISVGYFAWIIGFHYLYARKVGVQFLFWFTFGALGLWWLVDLFRIPSVLRSANEQAAREALATLGIAAAFTAPVA